MDESDAGVGGDGDFVSSLALAKGWKLSFAAAANVYAEFHEADIRIKCVRDKSANGSCADEAELFQVP